MSLTTGTAADSDLFQIDWMTGQVTVGLGKTVHPAVVTPSETAARVPGIVLARSGDGFTVTIKATDPSSESATVDMTITVDEVDEAPVFTAGETSHSHEENDAATATAVYTFDRIRS